MHDDKYMDVRAAVSMALANIAISVGMIVAAVLSVLFFGDDTGALLAVSSTGAYAALIFLVWASAPRGWKAACIGFSRPGLRDVFSGAGAMALWYPGMLVVAAVSAWLVPSSTLEIGASTEMAMAVMPAWLRLFTFAVLPAAGEEILCRGIVYAAARRYGRLCGILVPAACFAAMHGNVQQMAYAFLAGLLLSSLRDASGSIWPCIAAHAMFNSVSALAGTGFMIPAVLLAASPVLSVFSVLIVRGMYRRNAVGAAAEPVSAGRPWLFIAAISLATAFAIWSGGLF